MMSGSNAYTGPTASYVALSAVSILATSLLCSIWTTDVSGSIALLGLVAVYIASQEMLVLYMVFVPASILTDLLRGLGGPTNLSGRGWLIFLQLLQMAAKAAGTFFAYTLWRSVSSGADQLQGGGGYAGPPPMGSSIPVPGTAASYQRVHDPFSEAAYVPPSSNVSSPTLSAGHVGPAQQARPMQPPQQPPQHQQSAPPVATPAAVASPAPAAPHHDLV